MGSFQESIELGKESSIVFCINNKWDIEIYEVHESDMWVTLTRKMLELVTKHQYKYQYQQFI